MALRTRIDREMGPNISTSSSAKSRNVLLGIVAKNGGWRWDSECRPAAFEPNAARRVASARATQVILAFVRCRQDAIKVVCLNLG